ncbi:MAG: putative oxidoreductase [Paracoccaceae bacterium]|jgi:putative oxidoreductase
MNKTVTLAVRILLGAFLLIFGINKFAGFMPPPEISEQMGTVMGALMSSNFMTIIGVLEILCGVLLLVGKYLPLALTFTVAIVLNAALFHILMDTPANAGGALIALILAIVLAYAHKDRFSSLLSA